MRSPPRPYTRRFPRLPVGIEAYRELSTSPAYERIVSVSAGGFGLVTTERLADDGPVVVHLFFAGMRVPLRARVSYCVPLRAEGPFLIGMRLDEATADEDVRSYHQMIARLLETSEGLRRYRRFDISLQAEWRPERGPALPLAVGNLGMGGALLIGPAIPPPGAVGSLKLMSPDHAWPPLPARIVWTGANGATGRAGVGFAPAPGQLPLIGEIVHRLFLRPLDLPAAVSLATGNLLGHVGPFEVLELVARGGMGEIYRARGVEKPFDGQLVALKRLRAQARSEPALVDRFLTESDLGRMLSHRAIARVVSAFELRGEHWTAMEWIDGPSLLSAAALFAQTRERLPPRAVLAMAVELLGALDYCHHFESSTGRRLEVVHGDVTPSNLLFTSQGQLKLIDFGAATTAQPEPSEVPGVAGKLSYMPPEVFDAGARPSPLGDVYQVAVVLYEALAGAKPYGENVDPRRATPRPLRQFHPGVPEHVERAIHLALSPHPGKRPAGAFAFLRLLFPERIPTEKECQAELEKLVAEVRTRQG